MLPEVDNFIDLGIGHQGIEGLCRFFPNSRIFIDPLVETKRTAIVHLQHPENKFFDSGVSNTQGTLEIKVMYSISHSVFNASEGDQSRVISKRNVKV